MNQNTGLCKKILDLLTSNLKGILGIAGLCLALFISCIDMGTSAFNSDIWRAHKGNLKKYNLRAAMIRELEEKHIRLGMSRQQIINLLGAPDKRRKNVDIYGIGRSPRDGYEIHYQVDIVVGFKANRQSSSTAIAATKH